MRLSGRLKTAAKISIGLSLLVLVHKPGASDSPACIPLTDAARDRITAYVAKLAKIPAQASLQLVSSNQQEHTCYRRLEFLRSDRSARFTLLLSPDQRFLMPQLFDSNLDPSVVEAKRIQKLKTEIDDYIDKHNSPALGPSTAPVTIAVFSDLECPFCRRAMNMLQTQVLAKAKDQVRLAYISFPLPMHAWAKTAAVDLACVARQNQTAFWNVHDYLFGHQNEIKSDRLAEIISAQSAQQKLDVPRLKQCIDSQESLPAVEQDLAFGSALGVNSTPTLFISGRALVGAPSTDQILETIADLSSQAADKPQKTRKRRSSNTAPESVTLPLSSPAPPDSSYTPRNRTRRVLSAAADSPLP